MANQTRVSQLEARRIGVVRQIQSIRRGAEREARALIAEQPAADQPFFKTFKRAPIMDAGNPFEERLSKPGGYAAYTAEVKRILPRARALGWA
jgi:hypothetical protein